MSVDPSAQIAHAASLGAHLPPLLVAAERVAATVAQGVHGRRRPGQGDSFWQYRPLLPGEPVTRVDWRQSARSGKAFVRQTEWEAAQTVGLWQDNDSGMAWRSATQLPTKQVRARLLLLGLAALVLRAGEQVRLLGQQGTPFLGRAGLHRLAASLGELDRPDTEGTAPDLARGATRHATVVLLSDWLRPPEETKALLAALAAVPVRGQLVQVLDPAEIDLPYAGRVRFSSAAPAFGRSGSSGPGPGGQRPDVQALIGRVETVRETYRARLAAHQDRLAEMCRAVGFGWLVHRTDQPPQAALLALYGALAPGRTGR